MKETSVVHSIFGGYFRSQARPRPDCAVSCAVKQIKCLVCGYESSKFDAFLDVSLELKNSASIAQVNATSQSLSACLPAACLLVASPHCQWRRL